MTDYVRMYCAGLSPEGWGGYNAHPRRGYGNDDYAYIRLVPWREAIFDPPTCAQHNLPFLTIGGYRLALVADRIAETGIVTAECEVYYGLEQSSGCPPHNWYGRAHDVRAEKCPHQRLAAWLVRRHAQQEREDGPSHNGYPAAVGASDG